MTVKDSNLSGFHKMEQEERLKEVAERCGLKDDDIDVLKGRGLTNDMAERMIENVIGTYELPVGIATNFRINDRDYLVPMVIEESSVVAAASYAAKLSRPTGGFSAHTTDPIMISQIQVTGISDPKAASIAVMEQKDMLLDKANKQDPVLVEYGGGARDIICRVLDSRYGPYLIIHLLVDCRDAMGANAVNTMAEALAPLVEEITGGKVYLRILSNLARYRLSRARVTYSKDVIGEDTVDGVLHAYEFARVDPYRCATHNKGVMNGIISVVNATGNDSRAVEAGVHTYATLGGGYSPVTSWEKTKDGDLAGSIEIPLSVGIVGGVTSNHPVSKVCMKILGVSSAVEMQQVMAAVGLAQNFAALRALSTEGIQKGHMKLHAQNVAIAAGAPESIIDRVVDTMVKEGKVRADRARELIEEYNPDSS